MLTFIAIAHGGSSIALVRCPVIDFAALR